jgi:hypothetical protein
MFPFFSHSDAPSIAVSAAPSSPLSPRQGNQNTDSVLVGAVSQLNSAAVLAIDGKKPCADVCKAYFNGEEVRSPFLPLSTNDEN